MLPEESLYSAEVVLRELDESELAEKLRLWLRDLEPTLVDLISTLQEYLEVALETLSELLQELREALEVFRVPDVPDVPHAAPHGATWRHVGEVRVPKKPINRVKKRYHLRI